MGIPKERGRRGSWRGGKKETTEKIEEETGKGRSFQCVSYLRKEKRSKGKLIKHRGEARWRFFYAMQA